MMITYEEIKKNSLIHTYIERGDAVLGALGFTEHSVRHAVMVAEGAGRILRELGYDDHLVELAKIAGYMHDIGNTVNRYDHAHHGALMAFQILNQLSMEQEDIAIVVSTIGNHDEKTGTAVDAVSAAVILADKTDVRRNRVRNQDKATFDKHDRVNYAATRATVTIHSQEKIIHLDITLDESMSSIMDYFEIFMERMLMCRRAAEKLGMSFRFTCNGTKLI